MKAKNESNKAIPGRIGEQSATKCRAAEQKIRNAAQRSSRQTETAAREREIAESAEIGSPGANCCFLKRQLA